MNSESKPVKTTKLKHCPSCNRDLPIAEFGICRARKDGRNLYCRSCIRKKVAQSRVGKKSWRRVQKDRRKRLLEQLKDPQSVSVLSKQSPVERVRNAIRRGLRTQAEIRSETKLGKDEIGDALAVLIIHREEVVSYSDGSNRYYFIREVETVVVKPQRKDSVLSLSCLGPVIKGVRQVA